MRKLLSFLNNMDARAWRTAWVTLALLAGVGALIVLGKSGVLGVSSHIQEWMDALRAGPWGLPVVIAIFVLTAYIAAPQFMLIAACVAAFGPWLGFWYAMAGTVVSGVTMFYTGRWMGADFLRRYGGSMVNRMSRFIGRNDFLASLIVRNVPVAPAIVVNMAFGVSHADFWRYMAGLTLGSIPKTAVVAALGQSVMSAMNGAMMIAIGIGAVVVAIWLVFTLMARKAVRAGRPDGEETSEEAAPAPAGAEAHPRG